MQFQHYVGVKIVKARPMTREEYNLYLGQPRLAGEVLEEPGFLVEYLDGGESNHHAHDGYISWCPAEVFKKTNLPLGDQPDTPDWALKLLAERAQLESKLASLFAELNQMQPLHPRYSITMRQRKHTEALIELLNERLEMVD